MLDHALDNALLAHLKALPQLAALNGYTGQDNAEHKLPALTISTTTPEALVVFLNAKTEKINVLHRRKDGGFGLMEPVFA